MQADLAAINPPRRSPEALEAAIGIRYLCRRQMVGRSQEVRHRILIPAFGGSNPPAPANCFKELNTIRRLSHVANCCNMNPRIFNGFQWITARPCDIVATWNRPDRWRDVS